MSLDSSEVRVAGTGHIYVAPVGTDFPASITEAVDTDDWAELGFVSEGGAKFKFGRDVTDVPAWQSYDPVRKIVTATPKSIAFDLEQWNRETIELALGGGEWTEPSPGEYEFEPPAESFIDERALIVEMTDGDVNYRFCYRKSTNTAGVEFALVRANAAMFPISMDVLAADAGAKPYFIQSDDPALEAVGS